MRYKISNHAHLITSSAELWQLYRAGLDLQTLPHTMKVLIIVPPYFKCHLVCWQSQIFALSTNQRLKLFSTTFASAKPDYFFVVL